MKLPNQLDPINPAAACKNHPPSKSLRGHWARCTSGWSKQRFGMITSSGTWNDKTPRRRTSCELVLLKVCAFCKRNTIVNIVSPLSWSRTCDNCFKQFATRKWLSDSARKLENKPNVKHPVHFRTIRLKLNWVVFSWGVWGSNTKSLATYVRRAAG